MPSLRLRSRGPVTRYALAVLVVVAATLIQLALLPVLPSPQFLFSYPAVLLVAWLAGLGPGTLASFLSALATAYFFLPPSFSFAVSSPKDQLDLVIFVALSVALVLMLERLEEAIGARDKALRSAHEASTRVEELREEFVAVITHDLRSPIAAISLGLQAALRRRAGQEDVVQVPATSLERMYRSAQRLGGMVGELLDASRLELSKLKLDRKEVDLGRFVEELVEDVRPSLRGHTVVTDLPSHPVAASIDPRRIAQVVTNLLDNASKYSRPESTIHVAVREDGEGAELTVKDEGPGIASADLPRLFDRFFQARRAREQRGGLGLGLYISKGIVDAHGGQLSVDSAQGLGSTFRVALPVVSSAPPNGT